MIILDLAQICEYYYSFGVVLEIHGQNLMIRKDFNETQSEFFPKYLYRDNGNVQFLHGSKTQEVERYYSKEYNFTSDSNKLKLENLLWRNVRSLLFGFVAYHAENYLSEFNPGFNIYEFVDEKLQNTFLKKYC
jgi:hypothetical protein